MLNRTVTDIVVELNRRNHLAEHLDEAVHQAAAECASEANNIGLSAQVEFLLKTGGWKPEDILFRAGEAAEEDATTASTSDAFELVRSLPTGEVTLRTLRDTCDESRNMTDDEFDRQQVENLIAALPEPDFVGSTEYRAIHELITLAEDLDAAADICDEFIEQAKTIAARIDRITPTTP